MAADFGTPTMLSRSYLSSPHLWAAQHFLRLASEIEEAHSGRSRFCVQQRAYVTGAVFSSVAFLEAAINELFQDAWDGDQSYLEPLDGVVIEALRNFWEKSASRRSGPSILAKYQAALRCAGHDELPTEEPPYADARLLVWLRNALVHFKPMTLGGGVDHELAEELKTRFPSNRLLEGSGNPYFPDKCLGAGCAAWAISSSLAMAGRLFERLGLRPNYQLAKNWEAP